MGFGSGKDLWLNLCTKPGAGVAAEPSEQPGQRQHCPHSRAPWHARQGSEGPPEIPVRWVQPPRNVSPLSAIQGWIFSKSCHFKRETKKNTRGSKYPNSLRTMQKRGLSSGPSSPCFSMCQGVLRADTRHCLGSQDPPQHRRAVHPPAEHAHPHPTPLPALEEPTALAAGTLLLLDLVPKCRAGFSW